MSKMIPQETVDALRVFHNVSISNYGIDCTLYIPNNLDILEDYDIYVKPSDYTYDEYTCLTWIEFAPSMNRLRALGIFAEKELPILARFPTKATYVADGTIRNIDVVVGSYIVINPQFVPDNETKQEEFEVVDIFMGPIHDRTISKYFHMAPRRVKS